MIFNYIFLLTNYYQNNFIPEARAQSAVIIPISKELWEEKKKHLQLLNSRTFTFCFGLLDTYPGITRDELSAIQDAVSLYFFLPNYNKRAGTYLLIADSEAGTPTLSVNKLEKTLARQGIAPLSKNFLQDTYFDDNINEHCLYNTAFVEKLGAETATTSEFDNIFKAIMAANGVNKQLIVPVADDADFKRKKESIEAFEEWLLQNKAPYVELLSAFKIMDNENQYLASENEKLKFRVNNYNDYLKLLRETAIWHVEEYHRIHNEKQALLQQFYTNRPPNSEPNQATISYPVDLQNELEYIKSNRDTILSWYEKEYESLPLWYKRFGHILKVMMGKRSFKSLYE